MSDPTTFNLADLWEAVAASIPDRTALVCGAGRHTFGELDERADRLAGWMTARGVVPGSLVGIVARNGAEHVEAILAAFKCRAAPVSVNFRYLDAELRHVLADAEVVVVVHDRDLGDRVAAATTGLEHVRALLEIGDGYTAALDASEPAARPARSGDDPYVLYTGGTTGVPKGVVWRSEDAFFACIGGGDPTSSLGPVAEPGEVVERILSGFSFLPVAPLMHAAGMWTVLRWLLAGGQVSLVPEFDPVTVWDVVEREHVQQMNIVGDAIARPLLDELERAPGRWDLTSLATIASGGAILTPQAKRRLVAALPGLVIKDTYGSTETGVQGFSRYDGSSTLHTAFEVLDTVLLDDRGVPLPAGGDRVGRVARRGRVPLCYHRDAERSAAAFPVIDGVRHAVTGDLATVDADGRLHLLGRGSQCINTGGEKVYPEEVESVLLEHDDVADAVVVGSPHPRWGQEVVAVVAAAERTPSLEDLRTHCGSRLAGFKLPRRLVVVPEVRRTTAGKADYRWAADVASDG